MKQHQRGKITGCRSRAFCLLISLITQRAVKHLPAHGRTALPGDKLVCLLRGPRSMWELQSSASGHGRSGPFWETEAVFSVGVTRTCCVASEVRPPVRWGTQPTPSFLACVPSLKQRRNEGCFCPISNPRSRLWWLHSGFYCFLDACPFHGVRVSESRGHLPTNRWCFSLI